MTYCEFGDWSYLDLCVCVCVFNMVLKLSHITVKQVIKCF